MPADHEAQSQVKDEEAVAGRKKEYGSAEFKRAGKAAPRAMQERSARIRRAIVADHSAHDIAKQATISELEAAMKTFTMRVDTAREQRDRHFSRAREGEVACERETNLHRQQTTML